MYKIGYIDDHPDQYENYRKKIKRRFPDIDLILFDGCKTKEEFLERIYKEQVDVMLIDYKMAGTFSFDGSTLINYINDQVRDLECFILTGVEQDKVADGLVAERNRYSKTIFDTEGDDEEKLKKFFDFLINTKGCYINALSDCRQIVRSAQNIIFLYLQLNV